MKTKAYVNIAHYDDRGDPSPPNSYRPELIVGEFRFQIASNSAYNGCMPIKQAAKIAKQIAKKLKIEIKHSWSVDTNTVEGVERYLIYKDGEDMGYAIEVAVGVWELYAFGDMQVCESLDECFEILKKKK